MVYFVILRLLDLVNVSGKINLKFVQMAGILTGCEYLEEGFYCLVLPESIEDCAAPFLHKLHHPPLVRQRVLRRILVLLVCHVSMISADVKDLID